MKSKTGVWLLRGGVLAAALACLAAGLVQQGYLDMLHKAIFICLECIGIG